jgi:hypothetical protein
MIVESPLYQMPCRSISYEQNTKLLLSALTGPSPGQAMLRLNFTRPAIQGIVQQGLAHRGQLRGQTGLMQLQLLLLQHFLALAAGFLTQCSSLHQSSH